MFNSSISIFDATSGAYPVLWVMVKLFHVLATFVFLNGFVLKAQTGCPLVVAYGDTTICSAGTIQLNATPGFESYQWSPSTGLSSDTIQDPVATVTGPVNYVLTATGYGPNLFANPDFSLGNVGFTSGYVYSPIYTYGHYYVNNLFFSSFFSEVIDHTPTSDGYFMSVDGATTPKNLWEQTVPVVPGENYFFEFWASRANATQPTFEIHFIGDVTGDVIMSTVTGLPYGGTPLWVWDPYGTTIWNATANTSLTVRVRTISTFSGGSDFGLDDFTLKKLCTVTDTVSIETGSITASINGPSVICSGSTTSLRALGGQLFNWSTGDTTAVITVSPLTSTTYSVSVIDTGGCYDTAYFVVDVLPLPSAIITGDTAICFGGSTVLTASGGTSFLWNTGAVTNSILVTPATDSTFSVIVSDTLGCSNTSAQTVSVLPLPVVVGDSLICYGSTLTLTVDHGIAFEWNTGSVNDSINVSPTTSTTYIVIVTSAFGCIDSIIKTITVVPIPVVTISGDTLICLGQSTVLSATGGTGFLWNTGENTTSINVTPVQETIYTVTVQNSFGCSDSLSKTIHVAGTEDAVITGNDHICPNETTVLAASGGTSFLWSNGESTQTITISPDSSLTYSVVVVDAGLCYDTASFNVVVDNCDVMLNMPNIFTPNGDGINDDFIPVMMHNIASAELIIFNRWGQPLVTITNLNSGWDGQYNGSNCSDGTYYWILNYTDTYGKSNSMNGFLTLKR